MKKVLSFILAFLFLYIIIVSFIKEKKIYENLENCSLDGFRKKTPTEINFLSREERELYDCQLNKFNKRKRNTYYFRRQNTKIQQNINDFNSENPNFNNVHSELLSLEEELTNRVIKRDKAKKDLEDLVNDEQDKTSKPPPGSEDIINNAEENSEFNVSEDNKNKFFNENKDIYNPF